LTEVEAPTLTPPTLTFAEAVYQGRNRLMNKTIVAMPAIRSAIVQRAASNLNGGSVEPALGAGLPGVAPAGGGGGALAAAAGARLAPQFAQKVAASAASL
jgi:hypothetical protein